jgi:putative ABC transport system ATP-binding protein
MALLRRIARERGSAVITVTHDHRMIAGFDTVYHLEDGVLVDVQRNADQATAPA